MKNELVSIAMATYNGEKFLREQLDSIYNQTYKNIEVVVCDDCPTDGTAQILEEYKQKYGLKYYINERNLGHAQNFGKAASLCGGEYIAFSDQDDIWLPKKIETLVSGIGNYSLIHSDAKLIDEHGEIFSDSYEKHSQMHHISTDHNTFYLLSGSFVQGAACLFKRKLLENVLPIPSIVEQHDVWVGLFASLVEKGIIYVNIPLILYRTSCK